MDLKKARECKLFENYAYFSQLKSKSFRSEPKVDNKCNKNNNAEPDYRHFQLNKVHSSTYFFDFS